MGAGALHRAWQLLVGLGILAIAAFVAMPASSVRAQQATGPATYPMTVTMDRVPGATGEVTITPLGGNQIRVDISISGLPTSPSSRAAHIHTAPGAVCDNNAPVTYPLNDVMIDSSGHGTSTTTVTLQPDKPVLANNAYVNVHEQANPPGPGVICANITQSYTAEGATATAAPAGATTVTVPPTGTTAAPMGAMSMTTPPAGATTTAPGSCVDFDSWCAYCSMASSVTACQAFVPPHASGTTATGAMGNSDNQPVLGVNAGQPPVSGAGFGPLIQPGSLYVQP